MKIYLVPLLLCLSCAALKKDKSKTESKEKTETVTNTDQTITERVDTVLTIPAQNDFVFATLPDLFRGVLVGPSKVKYDTITRTVHVSTPPRYVPYYINREIRTTIQSKSKTDTQVKESTKKVERKNIWGLITISLITILFIVVIIYLLKKNIIKF